MNQWDYNEDLRRHCGPDVPPAQPWLRPLQKILQVHLSSTTDLLPSTRVYPHLIAPKTSVARCAFWPRRARSATRQRPRRPRCMSRRPWTAARCWRRTGAARQTGSCCSAAHWQLELGPASLCLCKDTVDCAGAERQKASCCMGGRWAVWPRTLAPNVWSQCVCCRDLSHLIIF